MNRCKYFVFGILLFGLPFVVNANNELVANCDSKKVIGGDNINCTLVLKDITSKYNKVEMTIENSANLTAFNTINSSDEWICSMESSNILCETKDGVEYKGTKTLGTVTLFASSGVDAGSDEIVTFDDINLYDSKGAKKKISGLTKSLRISSIINTLDKLEILIDGEVIKMDKDFSKDVLEYSANIESGEININTISTNEKAVITGAGKKSVNYGENKFVIAVTSEYGEKREYVLNVTRVDNRSVDSSLKELVINNYDLRFDPTVFNYDIEVDNEINQLIIDAKPTNSLAKIEFTKENKLIEGINKIYIKVIAENDTKVSTYILSVLRKAADLSNDASLKSCYIKNHAIKFNPNTMTYKVIILNEPKLDIEVVPSSEKAIVEIVGNENLNDGDKIIINVIAEDGTKNNYTINVEEPNANVMLTSVDYDEEIKLVSVGETLIIIGINLFVSSIVLLIIFSILDSKKKKK